MTWEYSEDQLLEQTAIDLFSNQLGWDTLMAFNSETYGEGSTLGSMAKLTDLIIQFHIVCNYNNFQPHWFLS
jgi:type I restriction enzyme R subunit